MHTTSGLFWGEDPFPALNDNWAQPSKSIVGKWTRTIGTTMVNDAEFTYSNNRINITEGGINPNNGYLYGAALQSAISAAIPPQFPNSIKLDPASIPTLWGGLNSYGSYQNYWTIAPWNNTLDLYVAKDDASKVIGKHTLKFGALLSWNGKNEDVGTSARSAPTFGSDQRGDQCSRPITTWPTTDPGCPVEPERDLDERSRAVALARRRVLRCATTGRSPRS